MAYHFSAHQFEDQYSPTKLGNWEYPKWYPERPRQRYKSTKVIADDNGHLLEGVKGENAWGNYVGTWDLPRRITREYVKKLTAPPERLVKLWGKKKPCKKEPQPPPQPAEDKTECLPNLGSNSSVQTSFERRNKSCSALDLRPRPTKLEPLVALRPKEGEPSNIKPGTLDEKIKNILDSVQDAEEKQPENPEFVCREIKALPRSSRPSERDEDGNGPFLNCSDGSLGDFEGAVRTSQDETQQERELMQPKKVQEKPGMGKPLKTPENEALEPLKNGYSGFQIAKRFHEENLRHKPLPDVIDDPVFKALNSGKHMNAGGALNVDSVPSAVGWKPYSAPRPTECSKLKVFRPKTGVEPQKCQKDIRPKTGDFTFKRRFLPIDLAICWDLKPEDPSDEPKRSPHIDGSNGSAAPAVFTMIRPNEVGKEDENISGSSQALAERITKGIDEDNVATLPSQINGKTRSPTSLTSNREAILSYIKPPKEDKQNGNTPDSLNSISPNAAEYARRHPKTAWTKEDTSKVLSDRLQYLKKATEKTGNKNSLNGCLSESPQLMRNKHHQSTPNLVCDGSHCGTEKSTPTFPKTIDPSKTRGCTSENVLSDENNSAAASKNGQKKRNCSACKKSSSSDSSGTREKTEFKAAFKAGVPRSDSTNSGSSSAAKSYKVPKMRLPYAKRSYSIGTLAPPFSLWRESNGQEYPEHWRLASVYQHSYKPINSRKRPLLASVYQ